MVKPLLKVEESLKICPPSKRPNTNNGMNFVTRKILNTDHVFYLINEQCRVLGTVQSNCSEIKGSFETNGYLHTEYPPVVIEDPARPGYYIGVSGFNRNQAIRELLWETMMYDIYTFDSPLNLEKFKLCSNHVFAPRVANTIEDIVFQISKILDKGYLENDDNVIRNFIDDVARDKTKNDRQNIFKKLRRVVSKYSNIKTYHCGHGTNSTEEFAKKYEVPFEGKKNLDSTGKLGYVTPYGNPKTAFYGSKEHLVNVGYQDVFFTFFIDKPDYNKLNKQRQEQLDKFQRALKVEANFIKMINEQLGLKTEVDEILKVLPFKYNGHCAQLVAPDPTNGGLPMEEGVVQI